jgi:NADH dehydrogenase/NADH:ubiquinone oxidoreductase subunit G
MSEHGRHSLRRVHPERLLGPIVLDDDEQREVSRAKALLAARELLRDAGSKRVAFVLSPQSSCEQLYATFDFAKKWAEQGTQPSFFMAGQPETAFCLRVDPENLGEQAKCPIDKKVSDDFLICADKNPNRAGLLALAQHFGVELQPAEALLDAIDGLDLLCVFGADLPFDEAQLDRLDEGLAETKLLYLGSHQGLLADMADVALPVCTHVEESGSFINVQGLRQHYEAAFEPHGLSQSYHQWLGSIAKKLGLRGALEEPAALRAATDKALKA